MTNNGVGKIGNYSNVIYDSGNDPTSGNKRIGISATDIELFNDIPPSFATGMPTSSNNATNQGYVYDTQRSSSNNNQTQQNNYQTLLTHREQPNSHIVYQDEHNQQLNSAVNKLLDKYAPDANPQNLVNTTTSRQEYPQANAATGRDESFSTFQTGAPSSSTATNNYSTIIRPNTGQIPPTQTQLNNNNNGPLSNHSRPTSSYDSFQHVIPPSQQQQQQPPFQQQQPFQQPPPRQQQPFQQPPQQQQQQQQPFQQQPQQQPFQQQPQQQQPQTSIPIKTKTGNITQVVPGKLYTLDDDPLHLLYDVHPTARPNQPSSSQQQSSFQTTFQPSNNFQTIEDPLTTMFTNASQRYPQQPITITRDGNSNGRQPFDLGNIIKRVQEDYLKEIQPYVSSVKFVEKDRAYGQNLDDIGFSTPVTIRRGFTGQADDILRRSFGRQDGEQKPMNRYAHNDYFDDVNGHGASNKRHPLEQLNSKQSITSVSSVSTDGSDYDDRYSALNNRKNKDDVRDQGTSPPRKLKQPKTQSQLQKRPLGKTATDEESITVAHPVVPKLARRISSDRRSTSSSGSGSYVEENYSAKYNEHEHPSTSRPNPSQPIAAVATSVPVVKPGDEANRVRDPAGNQAVQRSEDIHPAPPTLRSSQPNPQGLMPPRINLTASPSEQSVTGTGSEMESGSEDEYTSTAPSTQVPAAQNPPVNARNAAAAAPNPPTNDRNAAAAANNPRNAAAAAPTPTANDRNAAAAANNPRNAAAAAPTPIANDRNAAAAANNPRNAAAAAPTPTANDRNAAAAANNPRNAAAAAPTPTANDRNAAAAANNPRNAAAAAPTPTTNDRNAAAAANNPRNAAAAAPNPPTNDRNAAAAANNPRNAAAAAPNPTTNDRNAAAAAPNLHFNDRNAAAAAPTNPTTARDAAGGNAAQTGSTRLFKSDGDAKLTDRIKDVPASIGNKIRSLFRRK